MAKDNKNKETEAKPVTGKEAGDVFITGTGEIYRTPTITAEKLKKYMKNYYGAGITRKLRALFFGDVLEIAVEDEDGYVDEDLTTEIENMCKAKGVRLYDKIKIDWSDRFWFGESFFNTVWQQDGARYYIEKIRRLPPESFDTAPTDIDDGDVAGAILKGVVYKTKDQEIHYYQTNSDGDTNELQEIHAIKNPTCTEVAGEPEILPLTSILTMLDFAWKSQMQTVNRIGAPIMMLRIVNPTKDDIEYGRKVVRNWGKDTAFVLRDNMEVVNLPMKEGTVSLDTIDRLSDMVLDYWVPTSMIAKEGSLISNGGGSELELLYTYIAGIHRDIESAWEEILQQYLDANGYEGYRINLTIPDPVVNNQELKIKQAEVGDSTGTLDINEIRERLGAEERGEEDLKLLPAYKKYPREGEDGEIEDPNQGGAFTDPAQEENTPQTPEAQQQPPGQNPQLPAQNTQLRNNKKKTGTSNATQAAIMAKEQAELVDAIDRLADGVLALI
jgi:hypothetical protein